MNVLSFIGYLIIVFLAADTIAGAYRWRRSIYPAGVNRGMYLDIIVGCGLVLYFVFGPYATYHVLWVWFLLKASVLILRKLFDQIPDRISLSAHEIAASSGLRKMWFHLLFGFIGLKAVRWNQQFEFFENIEGIIHDNSRR